MCSEDTWMKIKIEYVTTSISLRSIADKYDIPFPTIRDRAKREMWSNEKGKAKTSIEHKTLQKVIERTSQKLAVTLQKELDAANLINEWVLKALEDNKQFNRHLVQIKEKRKGLNDEGNFEAVETEEVEEKQFAKIDSKALKDMAEALTKSTILKKKILGILDPEVRERLDMEREKLQLDKLKAGVDEEDEEKQTGIVYLPSVDHETYEREKAEELARLQAEMGGSQA